MLRSFLIRLILAAAGMFLFCTAAYIGLGWVAWKHDEWLTPFLKDYQEENIRYHYRTVMIGLLPGDRDGDGAMDGLEFLWTNSDWRTPSSHGIGIRRLDHPEFDVCDAYSRPTSFETGRNTPYEFLLPRVNQRLGVRGMVVFDEYPEPTPPSLQVRVKAPPHWLLASPGAPLQKSPLVIPVTRKENRGFVDFEIQPTEDANSSPESPIDISIDLPVSGIAINTDTLKAKCLWPGPALSPTVKELRSNEWPDDVRRITDGNAVMYRVDWPVPAESFEAILVEAAFDQANAEWLPISFYPGAATGAYIIRRRWTAENAESSS